MVPEGIAPAPVVVTATWGSPASLTPSPLPSNQSQPAVFPAKLLPVTMMTVPDAPEVGFNDMLGAGGTVKPVEASMLPAAGMSARTR